VPHERQQQVVRREEIIARLESRSERWDVLVIGGGATGLGTAVESASRGYRTLLFEQHDFSKGTSSRSTKLIHGGVRYLQQGNIALVTEALHERGLLKQNAPHLVQNRSFVVPSYDWWRGPFYGVGLKVYDLLAGRLGLGPSKFISRDETLGLIPNVEPDGLRGGVIYYDGQFDDSRLAVNLAQTIFDLGGTAINYMQVTDILKNNGRISGAVAADQETGREYKIGARVVVNATGIFTDMIRRMDDPGTPNMLSISQGVHIVLDKKFLPGDSAIMVPDTDDGRVLFAVPWHGRVLVGTTDTPMKTASLEPVPLGEEIEFILRHAAKYMTRDPGRSDVKSVFAGLRPLAKASRKRRTSDISRDHVVTVSPSGLVTVTGGKWTTYRKMGEDAVDHATLVAGLDVRPSITADMRVHGAAADLDQSGDLSVYGSDAAAVLDLISGEPVFCERLHPELPYRKGEVIWHVRHEMARSVEDVLARRTRALFLDAGASIEMAPAVAGLMAQELGRDKKWEEAQVAGFTRLARAYFAQ
jgi:glycerol-3-phosphate dehydrogenase